MIADMDGYANGNVWRGQMQQMYPGIKDTERMHHIKFRVTEIDRQAGRRGDVEDKKEEK